MHIRGTPLRPRALANYANNGAASTGGLRADSRTQPRDQLDIGFGLRSRGFPADRWAWQRVPAWGFGDVFAATAAAMNMLANLLPATQHQRRSATSGIRVADALVAMAGDMIQRARSADGDESLAKVAVELTAQTFLDDRQRLADRHSASIWRVLVMASKASHMPTMRASTGISRRQPTRIATAIGSFVVRARPPRPGRQRMSGKQAPADIRVGLDHRILVVGEAILLVQYLVRDTDLAQIVQEATDADPGHLGLRQAGLAGKHRGEPGDPPQMAAGIGIARFDHPRHDQQAGQQILTMARVFVGERPGTSVAARSADPCHPPVVARNAPRAH